MAAETKSLDELLSEKITGMMEAEREKSKSELLDSFNRIFEAMRTLKKYSPDDLLDEKQVAEFLGVTVSALQAWRNEKRFLPYIKLGVKTVRYRFKDIVELINSNQIKIMRDGRIL